MKINFPILKFLFFRVHSRKKPGARRNVKNIVGRELAVLILLRIPRGGLVCSTTLSWLKYPLRYFQFSSPFFEISHPSFNEKSRISCRLINDNRSSSTLLRRSRKKDVVEQDETKIFHNFIFETLGWNILTERGRRGSSVVGIFMIITHRSVQTAKGAKNARF